MATDLVRNLARYLIRLAVIVAAVLSVASAAGAQEDPAALERRVKAAFLFKFAGYVEWPSAAFARPGASLTIGVMGSDSIAAELGAMAAGKTVSERPVAVRHVKPGDSLAGVHMLFVGVAESSRMPQLTQAAHAQSILLVSESDGALAQGSAINFVVSDRRVRFEISLEAAEKSRLRLSSRLLAVAQQVRTGTP